MSAPRQSVTTTVRRLQNLGLTIVEVAIGPDGSFRVLTGPANDRVDDGLEAMREARRARSPNRTAQSQ